MAEQKKKRGPAPVILSRKVSNWINQSTTNYRVESWKVGGGHSWSEKK
ncbi:hypothetical protein [Aneurinibacillus migulanus]|uniref:Uncharacterized protein n=1 Tax=Aneurinibacillus migulanus TaxID=47500 RepID=A0A1G8WJ09_ANEMI|nr:hypothetical protein [Aneurinibacillus migulanus]MED0894934.1 hypothetical protein [Aneurinibacillus migulanus]MED1614423.1 hypothetical protein [Aneurinibacillus migulanus]GED14837.1 hypothetical protein AMI01nite_28280 [Aneurinibacillus migulanus]SDJ78171.1 hypothetical protein SAMN04487909_12865 [Aneurinibacillus migulanus]